jgi:hypothetical protein
MREKCSIQETASISYLVSLSSRKENEKWWFSGIVSKKFSEIHLLPSEVSKSRPAKLAMKSFPLFLASENDGIEIPNALLPEFPVLYE